MNPKRLIKYLEAEWDTRLALTRLGVETKLASCKVEEFATALETPLNRYNDFSDN